jgi:hypothetical protein
MDRCTPGAVTPGRRASGCGVFPVPQLHRRTVAITQKQKEREKEAWIGRIRLARMI